MIPPLRPQGWDEHHFDGVRDRARAHEASFSPPQRVRGISQHMPDALQVNPWDLGVHHDVSRSSVKSTPIAIGVRLQSVKTLVH